MKRGAKRKVQQGLTTLGRNFDNVSERVSCNVDVKMGRGYFRAEC
jgi:hypothetical protein